MIEFTASAQDFVEAAAVVILFTLFMPLLAEFVSAIIREFWPQ